MMGRIIGLGSAAATVGEAVSDVAEVFVGNRAARDAAEAEAFSAVVEQAGAEYEHAPCGAFNGWVNGLNRLPRPLLALSTLGLFGYAMVEPDGFGVRMQGLSLVPEPLWWLLGAIVSFYFGARELHYLRDRVPTRTFAAATNQRLASVTSAPAAASGPRPRPRPASMRPQTRDATPQAADPNHNAALEEWRSQRG
ncbi:MAG: holin family protein [Amaricoccus sp.]|nr:holin family protein [Amaricoccus sp.]